MDEVMEQPGASSAPNGSVVANPFGAVSTTSTGRNALSEATEQRAIAEVQAAFVMAQRFPRDERVAVDRIINSFSRPSLAERATYEYSRGGSDITGPSIRAAEAIAQQWGNIDFGFSEIGRIRDERGVGISLVRAQAVDLQSRTRRFIDFHVRHWRDTRQGGYALRDERDIYELVANQAQRRVRACILALVPGDVIETAMMQAETTLKANVATDAEGIRVMLEAFEPFGVTKDHIEKRIQRRISTITAGQMMTLKRIYQSLRDGMSEPGEWFDLAPEPGPGGNEPRSSVAALGARLKANGNGKATGAKAAAPAPQASAADETPPPEPPEPTPPPAAEPPPAPKAGKGGKAAPAPAPEPAAPQVTYAVVMDRMQAAVKAKDLDQLDEAASLIGSVAGPPDLQTELRDYYDANRPELA